MRFFNLFLCCSLLIVMSCSDSTGPGDTGDGEILAHQDVGTAGGVVTSDEIELEVPAGAFNGEESIALTTAPENPFDDDAVSGSYIIGGLPQSFSDEITLRVAYDGELSEHSYIAVGVNTFVSSYGEMATTYTMLPAEVDGDMLTATLPAMGLVVGKVAMTGAEEKASLKVVAVKGYEPHVTSEGHFKIDYSSRWTTRASVEELGQYLEEAFITIPNLGFSIAGRTNWPVSVTVHDLGTKDGASSNSLWGDNYGYIEINRNIMNNSATMRTTAGHEFFHLVQSLYDPRNFYSKAKSEAPQLWLDEACSVWVEEIFSDQQNYVSAARAGNVLAPYKGVVAGAKAGAGDHGYGLSGMIKYLVDQHGVSCLVNTYEALKNGSDALTALIMSTEEPVEWWEEFLREYTLGDIYGVELTPLTSNKDGMFRITGDADTLATFTDAYPDLSGNIYVIRLDYDSISEDAVLSLSVDEGGEVTAIKYRLNPLAVEFIGTDPAEVTVSGLKELTDGNWHLIALVSNSRSISPFTEETDITMTARVKKPVNPGFTNFSLHPELIGDFEYVSYENSAFNKTYTSLFYPASSPYGTGTVSGTTFSGSRTESGDKIVNGTYTITFDDAFQNILHIETVQTSTTPGKNGSGDSYHNVTFTAKNIPLYDIDGGDYVYRLIGDEITDQVTSMTFVYGIEGDRKTTLVDYRGGGGSDIVVRLWKNE